MDTIVRHSRHGYIIVNATVLKTLKVIIKKPTMFSIDDIKRTINNQLDNPREHVTRTEIRRAIVSILDKKERI